MTPRPRPTRATYDYSNPVDEDVRHRDEGRDHERRRLPARALRARADVPLRERRRHVGGRDRRCRGGRGRARARRRAASAKLAELPQWVGAGDNMFRLFQPQPGTRRFYALFTAGLVTRGRGSGCASLGRRCAASRSSRCSRPCPGIALVVVARCSTGGGRCSSARSSPVSCSRCSALVGAALGLVGRVLRARRVRCRERLRPLLGPLGRGRGARR